MLNNSLPRVKKKQQDLDLIAKYDTLITLIILL